MLVLPPEGGCHKRTLKPQAFRLKADATNVP
jgi:hypothetical protein